MKKINLSFSTLNQTINAPHCWLAKQMGLKSISTYDFEAGHKIHRIVQDHVTGKVPHPILTTKNIPLFEHVEVKDFDDNMRIEYPINEKYQVMGFVDGKDPKRGDILEIKSGRSWTAGDFARSPQWKIYALALPTYKKIWLVSLPKEEGLFMPETIKIYNKDITQKDRNEALDFINKGIAVIENIKAEVEKEMAIKKEKGWHSRSRFCYFDGCPWCEPEQ